MPNSQRTEEPREEDAFGVSWHLLIQQILSAYWMPGTENTVNTVDTIPAHSPAGRQTGNKQSHK